MGDGGKGKEKIGGKGKEKMFEGDELAGGRT